jgi:hypothetical protein
VNPDNPQFDAPQDELGASRGFIAAAALAVGLLTGFAGGYVASQKRQQQPPPPVAAAEKAPDVSALAYTEDAVPDAAPSAPTVESPAPRAQAAAPAAKPPAPTPKVSARTPGSVVVFSRPAGAEVYLDDQMAGTTPLSLASVTAGTHRIRIALPGHRRWETAIDVVPGGAARVAASLEADNYERNPGS